MKTFTTPKSTKKTSLILKKRIITSDDSQIPNSFDPTVIIQTLTILG